MLAADSPNKTTRIANTQKMVSGTADEWCINVDSPYVFTKRLKHPTELSRSDGVDETTPNPFIWSRSIFSNPCLKMHGASEIRTLPFASEKINMPE